MSTTIYFDNFDELNRITDLGKIFAAISSLFVTLKKQLGKVFSVCLFIALLLILVVPLIIFWVILKFKINSIKNELKYSLALSDSLESVEHYKALIFMRDDLNPRFNDYKEIMASESYPFLKNIPILKDVCNFVESVIEINNDLTEYLAKLDHKTANSKYFKFRSASELINVRTNAYEYLI